VLLAALLVGCEATPTRPDGSVIAEDAGGGGNPEECLAPRTVCGSQCVDTDSDPRHCGMCGNRCDSGAFCSEGECSTSCATPLSTCGDSCVDLSSSATHCGECDNPCGSDEMCASGGCVCADGLADCGGACVDRMTSSAHCGRCDNPCGQEEICSAGTCMPTAEQDCLDDADNDGDGDVDCADSDCFGTQRDCTCFGGQIGDSPTQLCESGTWSACGPCGPPPACSASDPCDYGFNCVGGECVFNDRAQFDVELVDAPFIPVSKWVPAGSGARDWDRTFFTQPDVYGEMLLTPGVQAGLSSTVNDTLSPVWNELVLTRVTARDLIDYFEVRLWDADVGADEMICRCRVIPRASDFDGRLRSVTCSRNDTEMLAGCRMRLRFRQPR